MTFHRGHYWCFVISPPGADRTVSVKLGYELYQWVVGLEFVALHGDYRAVNLRVGPLAIGISVLQVEGTR